MSQAGKLGNYLRSWPTVEEAIDSGAQWFTIRGTSKQFQHFVPVVSCANLWREHCRLTGLGVSPADYYFGEIPPPDSLRVMNGEACRGFSNGPYGMYLKYGARGTTQNLRHDLEQHGRVAYDLAALALLRETLGEEYEDLEDIWERYPDAIVEFTVWDRRMGQLSKRTLYWEVRSY